MLVFLAEEIGLEALAFMAIALFAFIWVIRLAFNVRKQIAHNAHEWHERMDGLEDLAMDLRREADELKNHLNDKIDAAYLEKRIGGLVELMQGTKRSTRGK